MTHLGPSPISQIHEQYRDRAHRPYAAMRATILRIVRHPANERRRCRALALYLLWQLWQRLVRLPWTIRLGARRRIRLYPHSVVSAFVLYYQIPDYEEMLFIRDYLRSGDRFVDVGANVGVYSLWASETDGVDVLAFEPSTFSHRRAVGNVDLNRLSDRIQVVRKAVGDKRGVVPLTTGLDAVNQISDSVNVTGTELVELTTLDHELDYGAAAIIKIDVEGRELEVLRGSRGVIARHRPALIVEVNDPAGLERLLQELGYRTWSYDPQTGGLAPATLTLHSNVIALADDDDARARLCRPVIGSGRS